MSHVGPSHKLQSSIG